MDLPELHPDAASHFDPGLEFKIDFASKGLYDVQQLEPTRQSPWLQAGRTIRVLQGLAKTNRKLLKAWENGGFEPGAGTEDVEGDELTLDEQVHVYYQIFVGPDQTGKSDLSLDTRGINRFADSFLIAAIQAFHSDRARFHDLSTAGFPRLQTHLAFLDDLQYSGLWTITEVPSTSQVSPGELGTSSLLSSPNGGTPTRSDTISSGRLSPAHTTTKSTPPTSLRTYWRRHVFPLRQDDLGNLGSKEVRFKLAESLGRDGRSLPSENSSMAGGKKQQRPSRLSRDSTSEMIGDDTDDQAGGRTPMNHKDDAKSFPFGAESEDADTPVNRSPPKGDEPGIRNCDFYVRAVELLIELAELVKELQERRLCIAICRPDLFVVQDRPGSKPSLALHTLSHLKPISRYDHAQKVTQRPYEINLSSAPAQVEKKRSAGELAYDEMSVSEDMTIEQAYVESSGIVRRDNGFERDLFDEYTMHTNLSYIAPETISEPDFAWSSADVYTWASGAYDLLTEGLADFTTPTDESADLLRDVHHHTTRQRSPLTSKIKDCPESLSGLIEKATSLDPDVRYSGMPSLLADLREIHELLQSDTEAPPYMHGRVDRLSRFSPPTNLLERQDQIDLMESKFKEIEDKGTCEVVCFYGESGTGKSKQVEAWLHDRMKERTAGRRNLLVGWAKMDQHQVRPLSGVVQVFEMLLSAVFTNPRENATVWKSMILDALPGLGSMFLSLLSPTWQDLLIGKRNDKDISAIDWETYSQRFKIWARNLFVLFASAQRPLVIFIDDWQWMESTERELWTELFEKKPLPHTLALVTYRIESSPLDMSPLTKVQCIESRPFSPSTIDKLLMQGFHQHSDIPEDGLSVLSSFLSTATKGNPLFVTLLLARLVKDEVLYFDYEKESWRAATEVLSYYSTSGSIEKFARWTLSRLSSDAQSALQVLSCMPAAQGANLDLVARLLARPAVTVRTSYEKAALYGIVRFTGDIVRFTHDRHQEAARALISTKDRSGFLTRMARKLESEGPENIFIVADLVIEAMPIDPQDWSAGEISELMLDAAQKSIRSAAFEAAHRYVKAAWSVLPVLEAQTWKQERERCQRMCTLLTAIASGLRDTTMAFPAVEMAYSQGTTIAEKITAATMSVRLHLVEFHVPGVYEQADRVFGLLDAGLNISEFLGNRDTPWTQSCPQTAESLTHLVDTAADVDDDDPLHADAVALSIFMVGCGPTIYTRLPCHADRWFDFATSYILRSRMASMHPATGYTLGVRAILFASEPRYELAAAYMELGLDIPWRDTSWHGSSEIPYKAIEYLRAGSIGSIDYSVSWNAAALSNSTDILIYISAIELGTLVLSGRSIPLIQERGLASLTQLKNDLAPVVRPFLSSFAQLASNLADSQTDPMDLWRLDGESMSWSDAEAMEDHGALIGVSFWSTALLNAVLFHGPVPFVRDLATRTKKHNEGWKGLIGHFKYLLIMSWCVLEYDFEDDDLLKEAHEAFAAFPLNVDFQGLRSGLFALESLRSLRAKKMSWSDALFRVESAVRTLSTTTCHLATGWLCLSAARSLRTGTSLSKRIWGGFAVDANQAFQRCGAIALGRQVVGEFPEAFNLGTDTPVPAPFDAQRPNNQLSKAAASPSTSSSDVTSTNSESKHSVFVSEDSAPGISQRLNIEGILKSFLAFATERDSKMLLKRVLGILIQITRADSAFLALQNASTNKLHLRGGGTHSHIQTYDLPVSDAAGTCPAQVLLHVAQSRKSVDSNDPDQMPLLRDGYFNSTTTKHIFAIPLFIQNQFTGAICLQGSLLRFSSSVKSHVELLATFAAIVLESHDVTASLEQSVRLRTTQLEQALTHRQTFISSITHELRTPLHSISGLTAIMENSSDLPEAQKENVAGIRSSAEDLQRIITDVLDLSKLENGSMQIETVSFDLRQVAEAALDSVANLAHTKDLEILLDNTVDDDPAYNMLGDPFRIKQCLLNLLGNAIRFTEKGQIRLGWTIMPSAVGGESIVFSIADTGIGIPSESRVRLFQPFSQVDASIQRKWGGTGLGLSITRNLAHIMKGSAWCESVEGKGSTFFFSVVVHLDNKVAVSTFKRETKLHVLLLCPPSATTDKLARNFQAMNARTTITSPGNASQHLADINAVVLDSGYSDAVPFVKRLSSERPDIKVTFLAELTDKAALLNRLADPNARIITKPVKAEAIYDFLDRPTGRSASATINKRIKPIAVIDKETASRHPLDILFVDDNPINRAVGLKVLKKFGYSYVDVATNGLEAVQVAEAAKYDLILMDLQMPVMDGHTAMSKISASEKAGHPQIVALTANADTTTRDLCMEQGFHGFLGKPLVIRELDTVFAAAHAAKLNHAASR